MTANVSVVGFVGELPPTLSSHAKNNIKLEKLSFHPINPNKFNHVL